ncbi:MAG: S9 family peptidase [Alphaproteobacteria bacterium]|nr:S9 family peptidase [Alphaproteobacteria bacterium]
MLALLALSAHATDAAADADAGAADPYLWLEEVQGKKALAWVAKQDKRSQKLLGKVDGFEALRDRVLETLTSDDRIAWPSQMGDRWTNFWQDGEHVQGIWRRTTREAYLGGKPEWETVIDLDQLSAADGKSWVWHGASCLPPEYRRCLVSLSDGGGDTEIVREFDTVDLAWVEGGFTLPPAKTDIGWLDADTVLVGTDLGEGTLTDSGYPRQVRRWKRGTPITDAEIVFEGEQADVRVGGWRDLTKGFERTWVYRAVTFFTSENWLEVDGKLVRIEVPEDAEVNSWHEWLIVDLKSDWAVRYDVPPPEDQPDAPTKTVERTWPTGSVLAIRIDDFLKGDRHFQPLFTPSERVSYAGLTGTKNHLVIEALDNVRSRAWTLTPQEDGTFARSEITGLPENGDFGIWALDDEEGDEIFLSTNGFLTPTTGMLGSAAPGAPAPEVFATTPARFDASGLVVEQHEAISADGTRIPYFQVGPKDLPLDGTTPTVLNGYGGFEIAMTPNYSPVIGQGWLERGGVYVLANIRGGGEFGPAWHTSALKENRHKAYEDFAAVAKDLIARQVTSPEHLGAFGGSNGGLLMGNMAMSYPELFEAIVCQVPLLDMKRYSHLLAGASWMGEYGDPDDPAQWAYIQTFSPYHLERADGDYPTVFFQTSTMDDRVHPGHARKMAAKMLDHHHDVLYWENTQGGHGGAANQIQRANMWAMAWTFFAEEL